MQLKGCFTQSRYFAQLKKVTTNQYTYPHSRLDQIEFHINELHKSLQTHWTYVVKVLCNEACSSETP